MHVRTRRRGGTRGKDARVSQGWSTTEKPNLLALALLEEFCALQTLELDSGERQLLVDALLCAFAARRGLGNAGRRKHDAVEADGANVPMGVDGWRDRSLDIADGRAAAQHARQRFDIGLSPQAAASGAARAARKHTRGHSETKSASSRMHANLLRTISFALPLHGTAFPLRAW